MIIAVFMMCLFIRMAIRLQNLLTRAAGNWQQHSAWMVRLRSRSFMSRTRTSTAELYYLRHMRSCAAAAMGNKDRDSSPSTTLQISGASFIGRLLQSIAQMVVYYAKIAMKLIIMF